MMPITFTQYLRPNGEKKEVVIDRPDEIVVKARVLQNHGCKFEIEELMNGMISMTVSYPPGHDKADEGDFKMMMCNNGPMVPMTVDRLINDAYESKGELE